MILIVAAGVALFVTVWYAMSMNNKQRAGQFWSVLLLAITASLIVGWWMAPMGSSDQRGDDVPAQYGN